MAQKNDVIEILEELGVEYEHDERIIEVYNKVDKLDEETFADFERLCKLSRKPCLMVSAYKGIGTDALEEQVASVTSRNHDDVTYEIKIEDGKALSWLYENGDVLDRKDSEKNVEVTVTLDKANINKFESSFPYKPKD